MGHGQSKQLQEIRAMGYEELRKNSKFEGEIVEDFRYGSGLIIRNQNLDLRFLLQTQTYTLLAQYNQTCDSAQVRMKLTVPTILQLFKYNGSEYINTNGKSFKISLLYEFVQKTLQDEIIDRANNEESFTENELFNLIDQVLSALYVFKHSGIKHGYIAPQTIFFDGRTFKLNDIGFMSGQTEYKRFLSGVKESCYLSPKLIEELGCRAEHPVHEYEKSQVLKVFSLARCILDSGLLQNVSDMIYDFNTFQVNGTYLNELCNTIELQFSSSFSALLRGMLQLDEEQRFSYDDCLSIIQKHVNKSVALEIRNEILRREGKFRPPLREVSPLSFRHITNEDDLKRLYNYSSYANHEDIEPTLSSLNSKGNRKSINNSNNQTGLGDRDRKPTYEEMFEHQNPPPISHALIGSTKLTHSVKKEPVDYMLTSFSNLNNTQRVASNANSNVNSRTKDSRTSPSPKPKLGQSTPVMKEEVPQSPLLKIKKNKESRSTAQPSPISSNTRGRRYSELHDEARFEDSFSRVLGKTQQLERSGVLGQNHRLESQPSGSGRFVSFTMEQSLGPEVTARLPQSDIIYMHSGKPKYINDIFVTSKASPRLEGRQKTDDFWV